MANSPANFEPVRYALIGFGRFCQNRLLRAFSQIENSRIVALYKSDESAALQAAREHGIARGYGKLQELLADPEVEAVYITSANADHEGQAIAAAQAGKHVLCEKPMATNAEACRKMIEAGSRAGVKLMVAQTLRFSPVVLQVRRWIHEGKVGRLIGGRALFTYEAGKSPRTWLNDARLAGGGALMDIGVHCIDTLRFLLGEVVTVRGLSVPPHDENPIERTAEVSLAFASGAVGEVFCSFESPYRSCLEITGELGFISAEPFSLPWAEARLSMATLSEKQELTVNTGNTFGALIESFSRTVRGLGEVAIPGEEGLENIRIIENFYHNS